MRASRSWRQATAQRDGPLKGEGSDKTEKANELAKTLVGVIKKAGDIVVAWQQVKIAERHEFKASNTKLEHEICLHCEESRVSVKSVHQQ